MVQVVELLPHLHLLAFPVGQVYLWRGADGLTLIDSGVPGSAPAIAAAIGHLGHRVTDVRRLLLTHHHEDHVGSAAAVVAWGDIEVYAHRADVPVIRGERPGLPPVLADWERPLLDRAHALMPGEPALPVAVDHELDDGATIDLGGTRAVAVAVPGHTPGSVAFHLPDPKILFTGDTIARAPDGRVMLGVFNVDPVQARLSLHHQAGLDAGLACFGHGAPATGAEVRAAAEAGA